MDYAVKYQAEAKEHERNDKIQQSIELEEKRKKFARFQKLIQEQRQQQQQKDQKQPHVVYRLQNGNTIMMMTTKALQKLNV